MTETIESVVVPLDGSDLGERVLPLAGSIAKRAGATLYLITVVPGPADAAQITQASNDLRQTSERAGVPGTPLVRAGTPADQILEAAHRLPHPLVVMTTHGRSGTGRWFIGSVADRVVRGGEIPVLLLRSGMPAPTEPITIKRIMVPLDGSDYSEAALPIAEQIAVLFDADVRLVRVAETGHLNAMFDTTLFPVPSDYITQLARDLIASSATYLAEITRQVQARGVRAETVNLHGFPTRELLAQEENEAIDLVVMTSHARARVGRIVYGSVAEQLLQHGQRPILFVHPAT